MKKFFQLFSIYPHILAFLAGYSLREKTSMDFDN